LLQRSRYTIVTATTSEQRDVPLLSIIMPVYNERRCFRAVLDEVVAKNTDGLDTEIIVVDSGSTDGTRQQVESAQHDLDTRVVYQDRPQGKGNAVRQGLECARGDFVLIQDADQKVRRR
jgi:glycosyltransferase involved in cell wall biosynthesis